MTNGNKEKIHAQLLILREKKSQNKLANTAGISAGYMSQIMNKKWDAIANDTWQKIQLNLGLVLEEKQWNLASTRCFREMALTIKAAKKRSLCIGIAGKAGWGKSAFYKQFAVENDNVFYIQCSDHWTKKMFFQNFLRVLGEDWMCYYSVAEMAERVIVALKQLRKPQVILDEMDKLKESPFLFFISLYNKLEDHCSLVVSGSPYFEKNVVAKAKRNKRGYEEFYSRIGLKFIKPAAPLQADITAICKANGINDLDEHYRIFKACEYDLRRVKREVIKLQIKQSENE